MDWWWWWFAFAFVCFFRSSDHLPAFVLNDDTIFWPMSCRLAASCYPECPWWDVDPMSSQRESDTSRLLSVWINHTVCWSVYSIRARSDRAQVLQSLVFYEQKVFCVLLKLTQIGKKKKKLFVLFFLIVQLADLPVMMTIKFKVAWQQRSRRRN